MFPDKIIRFPLLTLLELIAISPKSIVVSGFATEISDKFNEPIAFLISSPFISAFIFAEKSVPEYFVLKRSASGLNLLTAASNLYSGVLCKFTLPFAFRTTLGSREFTIKETISPL